MRQADTDETPLSWDEICIAVREGWRSSTAAVLDHRTGTLSMRRIHVADIKPYGPVPRAAVWFGAAA
jgi:hypothetical protein